MVKRKMMRKKKKVVKFISKRVKMIKIKINKNKEKMKMETVMKMRN